MKNLQSFPIVMLPTEKEMIEGSIIKLIEGAHPNLNPEQLGICVFPNIKSDIKWQIQHLYILSDEKVKEGDYGLGYAEGINGVGKGYFVFKNDGTKVQKLQSICHGTKKIIATTDKTLGLPIITTYFKSLFIKAYNNDNLITDIDSEMIFSNEPIKFKEWMDIAHSGEKTTYTKEWIEEELDMLISLNEDDFDRGRGKYLIRNWIKENIK